MDRSERRRATVPQIRYPPGLPITERRDDILAAIRNNQVVIVAGETGSGKSTQLPKFCLELGRGIEAMIGHTQPRRLAARTVAERVAAELGSEIGATVGYAVRFTDRVGDNTLIKVMTDGILLAETQRDRSLRKYDTIIIDEAHERGLNIDFLLGYLQRLLPSRPDLKIIITSATIDTARFSSHFADAPVIEVSGRGFPVEVRYAPYGEDADDDRDQTQAICDAVDELRAAGPGDILVFLSGEREIHDTADALRRLQLANTEVLPLYARLSAAEQHRVFDPHQGRHVVLATNVAETSLTVPGVRYVIDTGTARISRYSRRLKVQRLPIEAISQASANQRAGRCGRVAPGICIRLYGEDDYDARPAFTEPEILRTSLASVILQMASLRLGDVAEFPFVDPPDSRSIKDGVTLLEELGAFDPNEADPDRRLTALGRRLAQLPLDPRLGRMVLAAEQNNCVREVMVIAAALSIQDPRERPRDKQQDADTFHARFASDGSDFLSFVNLWDHLREQQRALSSSQFRRMCRNEFLNYLRVREWQDINSQLRQVVSGLGIRANHEPAEPNRVHISLLAGLLSQIGMRDGDTQEFRGARNARFAIAPGSVLRRKPPRWLMAAELIETNRLWARVTARIQPEWAERVGAHLCQRSYSEPRWQPDRGGVVATERVTLYGLPIVTGRTVDYGQIDPVVTRELFIRHALVDGEWSTAHTFVEHNRSCLEEIRRLEERVRRRGIAIDEFGLYELFDARIPADVISGRHFDRWWRTQRRSTPELFSFRTDELIDPRSGVVSLADYPDDWQQGDNTLALRYVFDPGSPDDGVTAVIPLALLNPIAHDGFEWQIRGLREEMVTALVRALPKPLRRHLVPIADNVRAFIADARPGKGPLCEQLGAFMTASTGTAGVQFHPEDFDLAGLPDHLRMTFAVVDPEGRVLARGKDLAALRTRLAGNVRTAIASSAPAVECDGLTDWTIGDLPRQFDGMIGGHPIVGFPALVDRGASVSVRVLTTEGEQAAAMSLGTRRLLALTLAAPRRALERQLSNGLRLAVGASASRYGSVDTLIDDSVMCALDFLIGEHGGPQWSPGSFAALRDAVRADLADTAGQIVVIAAEAIEFACAIDARLNRLVAAAAHDVVADIGHQMNWLVHPGFVTLTGAARLPEIDRYLRGIDRRLERFAGELARDAERMRAVQRLEAEVDSLLLALPRRRHAEAIRTRWMIEELRVSVFAQSLGTAHPVSEQRVRREIAAVRSAG